MNLEAIRKGDRRALSRFLTAVENQRDSVAGQLSELFQAAADSTVIGVTGPSGSGKSALLASLARRFRQRGQKVAIVAVDPTSPFSGGAILGDRIRMRVLCGDDGVFIRSMASRGNLGGLAWRTQDVTRVLAGAGYPIVIVETVDAGQSEVEIAALAHTTIVVQAPGAGDDVQAFKAGILEIADILAVNKSDLPGAERTKLALQAMVEIGRVTLTEDHDLPRWTPPVIATSAPKNSGIERLATAIDAHRNYLKTQGLLEQKQVAQLKAEFMQRLGETLRRRLFDTMTEGELAGIIGSVSQRRIDPQQAVNNLLGKYEIHQR